MYHKVVRLGVMPTKRGFLPMDRAKSQKDAFMAVIRSVKPESVSLTDIDGLCENGIACQPECVPAIINRFKEARIDALFLPFCDFGEETVVAAVASALRVPTLVWGNRDEDVNTDDGRGRDTQCGMFAATKVLRRQRVIYSYIFNCETGSEEFRRGFERFVRVAAIVRDVRGLRIAKIGDRPPPFMSVMSNEGDLLSRFGITCVPVSTQALIEETERLIKQNGMELRDYHADLSRRIDLSPTAEDASRRIAAFTLAARDEIVRLGCTAAAMECWSGVSRALAAPVCMALGELADMGLPVSCETDVNGAVTLAILRACLLYEEPGFLADLTVRHPSNDNAELLWHCGPFPFSLRSAHTRPRLVNGQERWELKQGNLTLCRFDDADGEYTLFCGEGKTTTGPETTGTYVWLEVDDWRLWEEKLMFGPYIHHIGGAYGQYGPVLREAARYLGIHFDEPGAPGPRCL